MSELAPTPSYALRELTAWIEHRTGGTEPRDQTRIELGNSMAKRAMKLENALEESVRLQAHYGKLLNAQDGGERLIFDSVDAWIARLDKLAEPGGDAVEPQQ
ncbi:MAG: hypothetical protein ACTSX8_03250 [Alphaproteobacteria bacterium]